MATDTYGSVNGIRSTLVNEPLALPVSDNTTNSIFIYGTAPNGPLYTPTKVTSDTVNDIFGDFTLSQYADRSLLKAYYEAVAAGGTNENFDVRLVRVGNVGNASVTLYEMNTFSTGAHASTGTSQSIMLTCAESGKTGNGNSVVVTGTASGIPEVLTINMTTGKSKSFYLDPINEQAGYIANVYDLLEAINSDADVQEAGITATTKLIESEISFPYVAASGTKIFLASDGKTYGDNLIEVADAYSLSENTDTMIGGLSTTVLSEVPSKSLDVDVKTIKKFEVVKTNELLLTAALGNVGTFDVSLKAKSDVFWDKVKATTVLSAIKVLRQSVPIVFTVADVLMDNDGKLTLPTIEDVFEGLELGDQVVASYKYVVSYSEAKYKSQLVSGNRGSYFVAGDTITFGAPQTDSLAITYDGKQEYLWGTDIVLYSRAQSIIQFANPDNMPVDGDVIYMTVRFLPELPAPTSWVLTNGSIQVGAFTGGEDGMSMSLAEYRAEIEKALNLTLGFPCSAIVIAGAYLNDTIIGYNSESGIKESQNINWHGLLSAYTIEKSHYVSECKAYLGLLPLETSTAVGQAEYLDKLITISATDTNRPANIVSGIEAYPLIVCANDFIVSVPKVSTSMYRTSPAMIYSVARQLQDPATSPITLANGMPSCVRGLSVSAVSHPVLNQINKMRYTFFIRDTVGQTNNIIPADAPTMAASGSSLDRQFVLDIVYMCQRKLRGRLQQYIGRANDPRNRQAMENSAKSTLKEYTPEFLSSFDVKIVTATNQDKIDGNVTIKYFLVTSREVRTISQETRLKLV